jgi:hypothetical protein
MSEPIEYCKNCYCAKLTISVSGQAEKVFICKFPPLIVEIGGVVTFSNDMTKPIEETFEEDITKVELISDYWHHSKPPGLGNRVACPLPGTYPIVRDNASAPEAIARGQVTDLYWKGKTLYCYFDLPGAYSNNVGVCTYKVFLGDYSYRFSDSRGVIYERRLLEGEELTYTVECDECCKDTEILCDHHKFPGYKCHPIPPTNARLLAGQNDIARYWR